MEFDKAFTPKHQRLCGVPLRCKRAVNSTLAGETIAMSAALAHAEWAQIMIQDILDQTVTVRNTTGGTLPFQVVLRSNCTLSKRLHQDHSIDAKSVFGCSDQRVRWKPSGSSHGCGPRNRWRNTHSSRLSHSLDPTPTHACRLDDEGRPVRWERCSETLAAHWKAGLGRRDHSTECTSWENQSSQSSTVGN